MSDYTQPYITITRLGPDYLKLSVSIATGLDSDWYTTVFMNNETLLKLFKDTYKILTLNSDAVKSVNVEILLTEEKKA